MAGGENFPLTDKEKAQSGISLAHTPQPMPMPQTQPPAQPTTFAPEQASNEGTGEETPPPQSTGNPKINYKDPQVGGKDLEQYTAEQITAPTQPPGTQHVGTKVQENANEFIDPSLTDINSPNANIAQSESFTVSDPEIAEMLDISPAAYEAMKIDGVTGVVDTASLLRYQLKEYMDDVDQGSAPWAQAAIRKANQAMLKRGLGASSMAGAAISQAILEAAVPLAQYDAGVFERQSLENQRNQQAAMLSNQASENAARNFNASSENEINKFSSELRDRIVRFNTEQLNVMGRFNVDQENSVNSFYDKMQNETDKFIANNKLMIGKSNAEWRRGINLANTATENAVMQQNVQNRFNLSQQAMADLWQRGRDVFHWANVSSENEKDRAFKLATYSLQRQDYLADVEEQQKQDFFNGIANLAVNVISDYFDD